MLPSASARKSFSAWRTASRIVVYDADSQTMGESSNIYGLLRKFKADGFQGELAWLRGGFQAVWKERRDLVDTSPPTPDADNDDEEDHHRTDAKPPSILRTRQLPMAAFSLSSTTVHNNPSFNSSAGQRQPIISRQTSNSATANSHPAFNPFFDAVRQNTELSHGITERIALRLPRRVRRRIHDLPFRWLQDIARRAGNAPHLHKSVSDSSSSESEDTDDVSAVNIEEGKEALAMQFFKIELAEQRRLMGIMEHHSKESGHLGESGHGPQIAPFPFSITAGVEKGAKNRQASIILPPASQLITRDSDIDTSGHLSTPVCDSTRRRSLTTIMSMHHMFSRWARTRSTLPPRARCQPLSPISGRKCSYSVARRNAHRPHKQ